MQPARRDAHLASLWSNSACLCDKEAGLFFGTTLQYVANHPSRFNGLIQIKAVSTLAPYPALQRNRVFQLAILVTRLARRSRRAHRCEGWQFPPWLYLPWQILSVLFCGGMLEACLFHVAMTVNANKI